MEVRPHSDPIPLAGRAKALKGDGMKDVMLTLIGPDRTGIVSRLAAIVEKHGGNWLDSRMVRLGGYFSGVLRIALPIDSISGFGAELARFMKEVGYQHSVQPAELDSGGAAAATAHLEISGQDHPGIVHAIFRTFREYGVNVEELSTGLAPAPWSGTPIFEARARVRIPSETDVDALRAQLEGLAADLLVEIVLS